MASSCSYFIGSDFSNQTLVITREGESNCFLSKTSPIGVAVPCKGNATATRVNSTHVLLEVKDDRGVKLMENGRDHETGKFAEPIAADCPNSPGLLDAVESPNGRLHYEMYAAVVLAILLLCLITFFIYKRIEKKRLQSKCKGHSATFSRCSNKEDTEKGQDMNGTRQEGPQ